MGGEARRRRSSPPSETATSAWPPASTATSSPSVAGTNLEAQKLSSPRYDGGGDPASSLLPQSSPPPPLLPPSLPSFLLSLFSRPPSPHAPTGVGVRTRGSIALQQEREKKLALTLPPPSPPEQRNERERERSCCCSFFPSSLRCPWNLDPLLLIPFSADAHGAGARERLSKSRKKWHWLTNCCSYFKAHLLPYSCKKSMTKLSVIPS